MGTWPIYKKHFLQLILTKKNFHLIKYLLATFIFFPFFSICTCKSSLCTATGIVDVCHWWNPVDVFDSSDRGDIFLYFLRFGGKAAAIGMFLGDLIAQEHAYSCCFSSKWRNTQQTLSVASGVRPQSHDGCWPPDGVSVIAPFEWLPVNGACGMSMCFVCDIWGELIHAKFVKKYVNKLKWTRPFQWADRNIILVFLSSETHTQIKEIEERENHSRIYGKQTSCEL